MTARDIRILIQSRWDEAAGFHDRGEPQLGADREMDALRWAYRLENLECPDDDVLSELLDFGDTESRELQAA